MISHEVIGGIPIEIIKKKNLKNLYIRVNPPEGEVTVSSPIDYPDEEIKLFVLKKIPEITKVKDRMQSQVRQSKREFVSGESHYLWGKLYRLQVISEGNKYEVVKNYNKIIFYVPNTSTVESRERAFNEWYRKELNRVLNGLIIKCEQKTNLSANEYKIKNMRTKWGTCNIDSRRIWINLQLAKKPVECLEYVLIHEMVHLLEKNHTNRFHALVEQFYPTWRVTKKVLSDMPLDYIGKDEEKLHELQNNY